MVICQTPYRISLFGGGTDYPDWYLKHGGHVLSTTIDKYVYISCRYLPPFFEHKLRLVYSLIEDCESVDQIKHPAARNILQYFGITEGLEIHYDGDLPARSGMGSSSAFTVGLLNALYAYRNENVSPRRLAKDALHIEQNIIGENVGSQDQVNAAYGGFNKYSFCQDGNFEVSNIDFTTGRKTELNENLMLFYTGIMRTADSISASYAKDTEKNSQHLQTIHRIVEEAIGIIQGDAPLESLGSLLHESWLEKKKLAEVVTNSRIDAIYETAMGAGALGGKVTGAGGGGMMLLYVPKENQSDVRTALSELLLIPFRFSDQGSTIIFSSKQRRYDKDAQVRTKDFAPFVELLDL